MKDQNMVETKRLKIYAATKEQMEVFIAVQSDDEMRAAYTEMLNSYIAQGWRVS